MGIGEVECNPWIIKACIEAPGTNSFDRSLGDWIVEREFADPVEAWQFLYDRTIVTGRRGAGICALGAVDMALWDLYAKSLNEPVWKRLRALRSGGEPADERSNVAAYASLLPVGSSIAAYRESMIAKAALARELGFDAVKIEVIVKGPYAVNGLRGSNEDVVELATLGREVLGPDVALMIDVGYCWSDWREAAAVMRRLEPLGLLFVETPLAPDDLDGSASLADATAIPLAAGELLQTRFEFDELMRRAGVQVVQPDVGRVGGITEAMRVARMAEERGLWMIPHCWKSGIGIAASAHVAFASRNCPFIEYLPPQVSESFVRREMLSRELPVVDGRILTSEQPGLGVVLNERFVKERRVGGSWLASPPAPCSALDFAEVEAKALTR